MFLVLVSPHLHRSSFDPTAPLSENPVDLGLYCPKGHRLRDRHPYTNSGHHCDECETPLVDGVAGKFCQVVCCATRTVCALSHSMFQLCDYDVCAECIRQMESSPLLPRQSPQGSLAAVLASAVDSTLSPSRHLGRPPNVSSPLLPRQSPQGNLAAVMASAVDASALSPPIVSSPLLPRQSPQGNLAADLALSAIDASALSPSRHPGRPPLFPIFFMTAPAPQVSHEVLFNAAAASPLRPSGRQNGRLRLRVSTPPQLMAEVTSVPRLQPRRSVSSPGLHASRLASILAITTPPRVGFSDFLPCQLFPDSPIPSILLVHQDAAVQTSPRNAVEYHLSHLNVAVQTSPSLQTSPRDDPEKPVTARELRNAMHELLVGLGFFIK